MIWTGEGLWRGMGVQFQIFWGSKNDYCQGQNKEMTPAQGCKWLYWGVRIRKWPQNVSQGGFKDDHN